MSQYVDSQNQELLWKMFHRIPETSSLEYPVRETLFKEAISIFTIIFLLTFLIFLETNCRN